MSRSISFPREVAAGAAHGDQSFRLGGMVKKGSVQRAPGSLQVSFVLTDFKHDVPVKYTGVLPDLFREGQGVIAHGRLDTKGVFVADEVLAKHDEKYMPPKIAGTRADAAAGRNLMLPELGHFALVLALLLAGLQAFFGIARARRWARDRWVAAATSAVAGQFVMVATAVGILVYAFVNYDFSVLYVAENSNSALPLMYRIAALWGAHEGSLLLWIFLLAVWTLAVAIASRNLPERFAARVLGVLGVLSFGFLLFTLATSDPFRRLIPRGARTAHDLNPLLQDPGLAIHPPMLYTGYVGLAVAFSFACAAMLEGRMDPDWARWTRPWTTAAWAFLTCGITLGSWWSYYSWAGAATGRGIRSRTPPSCPGWWPRR